MIVKSKLSELRDELAPQIESVCIKGKGTASFIYATNKGRAVEISDDNGGYWLEFWEKSGDDDAAPVREFTVESAKDAVKNTMRWLR